MCLTTMSQLPGSQANPSTHSLHPGMAQEIKIEFRATKPLPYELGQYCTNYFEEDLCTC